MEFKAGQKLAKNCQLVAGHKIEEPKVQPAVPRREFTDFAKTPCRLMNYWWLKVFALPIVRLGNSRVLGPWALETGQLTTHAQTALMGRYRFHCSIHKIINYNIFLEALKPTSSNFGVELIRIWSSKFMKCSQALKSAVYINCKNKK